MRTTSITLMILVTAVLTSCVSKQNTLVLRTSDGKAYYRHYTASNAPSTYMSSGLEYCEYKAAGIECEDLKINLKKKD